MKTDPEITKPLPDVEVPPVVQLGGEVSPEDARQEARGRTWGLVIALALILVAGREAVRANS